MKESQEHEPHQKNSQGVGRGRGGDGGGGGGRGGGGDGGGGGGDGGDGGGGCRGGGGDDLITLNNTKNKQNNTLDRKKRKRMGWECVEENCSINSLPLCNLKCNMINCKEIWKLS